MFTLISFLHSAGLQSSIICFFSNVQGVHFQFSILLTTHVQNCSMSREYIFSLDTSNYSCTKSCTYINIKDDEVLIDII